VEQPIVIRYRWTADELYQACRYHFRHGCRRPFRFGLHLLFGVLLVGGVHMFILEYSAGGAAFAAAIAFLVVGVYWFAFFRIHWRWMVRRRFRKRPDRDIELEWQVADEQIQIQSTLGRSEVTWLAFTKMVRTPHGAMLYPTEDFFHWLPRRGFESDAEYERFLDLAKSRIPRYYDVV
jgi:hypothetical protein